MLDRFVDGHKQLVNFAPFLCERVAMGIEGAELIKVAPPNHFPNLLQRKAKLFKKEDLL